MNNFPVPARIGAWMQQKIETVFMQISYLLGDDSPANTFYQQFLHSATIQVVPGIVGKKRGHGSQTVVVDFDLTLNSPGWPTKELVLKFERIPGIIPEKRLAAERKNELLARKYLDHFMPQTLRIIGYGLDNAPSALTFQQKVKGKQLRATTWYELTSCPKIARELLHFCYAAEQMAEATGTIPDLCGTLAYFDQLSNLFWRSRNIMIDFASERVWLVDTGWKEGEESLRQGSLRTRVRTWFRLQTMRFLRWRLQRFLKAARVLN